MVITNFPVLKRCAAEDVLLRTFCPFPAQGFGRWCAGMVWKWVRELANARTHSWSECGDGHDMNSVGAGVGGGE